MTGAERAAGSTHVGLVRDGNEDAYGIARNAWAVADGLGGHPGGEVASRIAVDSALRSLQETSGTAAESALLTAYAAAADDIAARARTDRQLTAMATTLVLAIRDRAGAVHVANLGDSRAYLLAGDELQQVTRDDNVAELLLAQGALSAEQARTHPGQFSLTKALGHGDREPTIRRLQESSGRLLLCSDGVNSELTDDRIRQALGSGTAEQACDALVAAALEAGGADNVTAVVVDL
ncbi:N/A [soil metagenome]